MQCNVCAREDGELNVIYLPCLDGIFLTHVASANSFLLVTQLRRSSLRWKTIKHRYS
jgi:hypothetical protein